MLHSVEEVAAMIERGDTLILAGDAPLLSSLPKGKWIGGCVSRFIENGKTLLSTRDKIFVQNLTDIIQNVKFEVYGPLTIRRIYDDAFDNGFSVIIMPPFTEVANEYSINCTGYSNFAARAVCGWCAVTPLYSEYEQNDESLVYFGKNALPYDDAAIVMHVELPADKYAEIHAFSPFKPEGDDVFIFEENGHQVEYALINGKRQNFRQYLLEQDVDRKHDALIVSRKCLACEYEGLIMNVAIRAETEKDCGKYVSLGVPVYKNIPYRFANLDSDLTYEKIKKQFNQNDKIVFSLTCITNYLCPDVFTKYLTEMNGPFTYGEIAYYLLNNATVYVTVGNV